MKVVQVTVRYWLGDRWGEEEVYDIVTSASAPEERGQVNADTDLARAVLSSHPGDEVRLPNGTKVLVEKIVREPELFELISAGNKYFQEHDDSALIAISHKLATLLEKATHVPRDVHKLCRYVISAHLTVADVNTAIAWLSQIKSKHFNTDYIRKRLYEIKKNQGEVLLKDITDTFLLNRLADLHKDLDAYRKAKYIYERSLQLDNRNIYTYNGLGGVCRAAKWLDEGTGNYEKACKITPNAASLIGLGGIFRAKRQPNKAIKYFEKSLKIGNEKTDFNFAHKGLGAAYFDKGEYTKGCYHFLLCEDTNDLFNFFWEYRNTGSFETALECLRVILQKDPNNTRAHNLLKRFSGSD